ncbi:MAG TPA: HAD-IIA family hydrolase [Actinomycetota bacterium]|nr:HAD-IIA family hydrolase [Actinomycetota bacterium]
MTGLSDRYEAFILDLDGVLYRGDDPVPGADEAIAALRERGRRIVFLTNNSARTPERVAGKLAALGISADPEEVVTSAHAAATLVAETVGASATAFVVGEEGVRRALAEAGLEVLDGRPDRADVVVVGWDRSADYDKLRSAAVLVQRGARLVATNADPSYPAPGGELWPGAGALLAAVETATGARAEVAGKPHRPLFDEAVRRAKTTEALVVGDRIETDIEGALSAGLDAALVLSGAAGPGDLLDARGLPVAVMRDVRGLLEDRPAARIRQAGPGDGEAVERLVRSAGLQVIPSDTESGRIFVAEEEAVLATAACERRGNQAYLRSVAVQDELRGSGLGTLLVAAAAQAAADDGAESLFLFTQDARAFFERLGFEALETSDAPRWIGEGESARCCGESATLMRRGLRIRAPS